MIKLIVLTVILHIRLMSVSYTHLDVYKRQTRSNQWKLCVLKSLEQLIISTYHRIYGHMGPTKVVTALEEHMYVKGMNKKVRQVVKKCTICQKVNNARFMTITSSRRLEKVFLDICGPFPRSGDRHRYKYYVIVWDHFSKYTKLYPISKASTNVILKVVIERYRCV